MKVADLVYDSTIGRYGIIIAEDIDWVDERSGNTQCWDYELLYDDGEIDYADSQELELVDESR